MLDVPTTIGGRADLWAACSKQPGWIAHLVGNSSGGRLALEPARRGRACSVGMWSAWEDRYRFFALRSAYHSAKVIRRLPALTRTAARRWMLN